MLGKLVISYTGKSSKTGQALYNALKATREFSKVVRVKEDKIVRNADCFIRWGNAKSFSPQNTIKINSAEAVTAASSKARMIRMLAETEGVSIPVFKFISEASDEELNLLKDEDGFFYVRDNNKVTRYDNSFNRQTDSYITKPINKRREYRVHVFNGKVIGIYEKVPNEEGIKLYKSFNCQFVRVNHNDPDIRCNAVAQAMCISAVQSLGLVFGGVDIMRERRTKQFFITEVNSAPALNSQNIPKYIEQFIQYIREKRRTI